MLRRKKARAQGPASLDAACRYLKELPHAFRLFFVSHNPAKIAHLTSLFDSFGLPLSVYAGPLREYYEDYSSCPADSLAGSLQSVRRMGSRGLFFIEDSALRVEALSDLGADVPGLATKEFFADCGFPELDALLEERGSGRAATMISRIALHIADDLAPAVFEGETAGCIAFSELEQPASTSPVWVRGVPLSRYFIPHGCQEPIATLIPDQYRAYDPRRKAAAKLLVRLAEYAAVHAKYSWLSSERPVVSHPGKGMRLFRPSLLVFTGHTASGKTAACEYLAENHALEHIEESDVVLRELTPMASSLKRAREIDVFLREQGPEFFARKALLRRKDSGKSPLLLSGVRTIEEIQYIRSSVLDAIVVHMGTHREICRLRYAELERNKSSFAPRDNYDVLYEQEERWGMADVERKADVVVRNSGNLVELKRQLDRLWERYFV